MYNGCAILTLYMMDSFVNIEPQILLTRTYHYSSWILLTLSTTHPEYYSHRVLLNINTTGNEYYSRLTSTLLINQAKCNPHDYFCLPFDCYCLTCTINDTIYRTRCMQAMSFLRFMLTFNLIYCIFT